MSAALMGSAEAGSLLVLMGDWACHPAKSLGSMLLDGASAADTNPAKSTLTSTDRKILEMFMK
jgi:hypothetical protein